MKISEKKELWVPVDEVKALYEEIYEKTLSKMPETTKNALLYGEWSSPGEGENHE